MRHVSDLTSDRPSPLSSRNTLPATLPEVVPPSLPSFQLLPVIESVVSVTAEAGDRNVRLTEGIEIVFPVATVRVGHAADPALLRTVLECLARRR